MAMVTFTHTLEAIQSIKMMKTATFYGRKLETVQDLTGPVPTISDQLPSGLANVALSQEAWGKTVKSSK